MSFFGLLFFHVVLHLAGSSTGASNNVPTSSGAATTVLYHEIGPAQNGSLLLRRLLHLIGILTLARVQRISCSRQTPWNDDFPFALNLAGLKSRRRDFQSLRR
jgi:hypothetical protein